VLDHSGEEMNKLLAFGERPLRPELPEGSLRHLTEVENLVGDGDDGGPALFELGIALHLRVAKDLECAVNPGAQLIAGRACPSAVNRSKREKENQDPENAGMVFGHRSLLPRSPDHGWRG